MKIIKKHVLRNWHTAYELGGSQQQEVSCINIAFVCVSQLSGQGIRRPAALAQKYARPKRLHPVHSQIYDHREHDHLVCLAVQRRGPAYMLNGANTAVLIAQKGLAKFSPQRAKQSV